MSNHDNFVWPHEHPEIIARVRVLGSEWREGSWQWILEQRYEENMEWLNTEIGKAMKAISKGTHMLWRRKKYNHTNHPDILL